MLYLDGILLRSRIQHILISLPIFFSFFTFDVTNTTQRRWSVEPHGVSFEAILEHMIHA